MYTNFNFVEVIKARFARPAIFTFLSPWLCLTFGYAPSFPFPFKFPLALPTLYLCLCPSLPLKRPQSERERVEESARRKEGTEERGRRVRITRNTSEGDN